MAEVNRVMEQINRHADNAHLIMGAAIEDALGDRMTVTLVAARRRSHAADLPKDVEPEPAADPGIAPSPRGNSDVELLGAAIASKPVMRAAATKPEAGRGVVGFAAPEPEASPVATLASTRSWRSRKKAKVVHPELQLETVTKGPFEHSEPTLRNGVDLDVPTFVRRGMPMN